MSELQCSREECVLRGICRGYSGYQKSSRSMKLITDWNDMEDNSDIHPVHMHIIAQCFERWLSELITRSSMI